MNKKTVLVIALVVVLLAAGFVVIYKLPTTQPNSPLVATPTADPRNGTYLIDGQAVELKNGSNDALITDSASTILTRYFGNDVRADLNGDGVADAAFILTQQTGGTGTFYYVAALLSASGGFVGTNAILLGDRIAPQTTEYLNGQLVVNFADRKPGEPMTAMPSVGVSKYFKVEGNKLTEFSAALLTETEARLVAEKSCIKGGEALNAGTYNENSKSWWFDANLNATRPGCSPACVVDAVSKTVEINWRCTGLLPPPTYNLDKTFVDKKLGITYQYIDTLPTTYYKLQDWKQTAGISLTAGELVCDRGRKAEKISLYGKDYCVMSESGAAAGTIYTTYTYATAFADKVASLKFVISHPTSCLVYEDSNNQTLCANESFASNNFAVQILSTVKLGG